MTRPKPHLRRPFRGSRGLTALGARLVLLLALVLSALFAPGTMPARAADGSFRIELCTPEGRVLWEVAPDGRATPVQPGDGDDPDRPRHEPATLCAFAALGAPVLAPGGVPILPLRRRLLATRLRPAVPHGPVLSPPHARPAARAPPSPVLTA